MIFSPSKRALGNNMAVLGVGDRAVVNGNVCTVRWGPDALPDQGSAQWYGIEYDAVGKGTSFCRSMCCDYNSLGTERV